MTIDEAARLLAQAEHLMTDAAHHLSTKQMGQDNNEYAGRMNEWLDAFNQARESGDES